MTSTNAISQGTISPTHAPNKLDGDTQKLLAQLDACVDRMRTHISDEPYITTIPQDEPKFHHYSRQLADAWLIDTPFDPTENYQIQYLTFFYREPYSDIYERVRSSHFDRSNRPPPPAAALLQRSATNTPSLGPKKKISLAAYKNKQANAGIATPVNHTQTTGLKPPSPTPTAVVNGSQAAKEEDGKTMKKVGGDSIEEEHEDANQEVHRNMIAKGDGGLIGEVDRKTIKGDRNTREDEKDQNTAPRPPSSQVDSTQQNRSPKRKQPTSDHSTPPKKPRLSTPPSEKAAPSPAKQSRPHPLPAGRLSPLDSLYLPGRLSPTLPPQIIAALDRRRSPSPSDSSPESDEPLKNALRRPSSKHDSVLSQMNDSISDPIRPTATGTEHGKSLMVVLKISKKHRASFRRLVQFTGRPVKDRRPDPLNSSKAPTKLEEHRRKVDEKDDVSKGTPSTKTSVSSKIGDKAPLPAPSSSSASKRPRPSDDLLSQPQAKRKNPPSSLHLEQNPSTPVQPSFRSPALPAGANRSTQATPTHRNQTRGPSAMQRLESSDGFNPTTPVVHDRTPASKTTSTGHQLTSSNLRPSPSSTSARTPESQAWSAEFSRLSKVAKDLKHAAPEHSMGAANSSSSKERKLAETAALSLLESLLAFILAFYCNDKSYETRNPPQLTLDPQNWISCHPFWRLVKGRCQPYPHLAGVVAYLGAVYNGIIMRRLSSSPNARFYDPKALQDSVVAALKAAEEASAKLSLATIKSEYPATWKTGISGVGVSSRDSRVVSPGHYEGGFTLDVGIHTDPQEAVRFAYSLLTEWCARRKEGEYTLRLKLSSSSSV